jgi:hypothetical protein
MTKDTVLQRLLESSGELIELLLNEQLSESGKLAIADLLERGQARVDLRMFPAGGSVSGHLLFDDGAEYLLFRYGPQSQ